MLQGNRIPSRDAASQDGLPRLLTQEIAKRITDTVFASTKGGGLTEVYLYSGWTGRARWARNRIFAAEEFTVSDMNIRRMINGATGSTFTNRLDAEGIRASVSDAEFQIRYYPEIVEPFDKEPPLPSIPHLKPDIWSEKTVETTTALRGQTARMLIESPERRAYVSAGELLTGARGHAYANSHGVLRYYPETFTQCSVTVRDIKTRASGWAGRSDHDWARMDMNALGARALEKCERSKDPKAIEPGRYTAILEAQAVHDLFRLVWIRLSAREDAEGGRYPFRGAQRGYSKINDIMFDRHLTLSADPMDPEAGFVPFSSHGESYQPTEWVKNGILKHLPYSQVYAMRDLRTSAGRPSSGGYRLQGDLPPVSMDEMIRTTKRGLIVTRFSNMEIIDDDSGLMGGFTRDGTWLVENGKVTYAVKNFRILESSIFAFNNVEQIGAPVRVHSLWQPTMAPALKVRDFNFASLIDAV